MLGQHTGLLGPSNPNKPIWEEHLFISVCWVCWMCVSVWVSGEGILNLSRPLALQQSQLPNKPLELRFDTKNGIGTFPLNCPLRECYDINGTNGTNGTHTASISVMNPMSVRSNSCGTLQASP